MPRPRFTGAQDATNITLTGEQRISADSHTIEPHEIWEKRLPAEFRGRDLGLDKRAGGRGGRVGGWDPDERLKDLALGGVSAEVLFPTVGIGAWRRDDLAFEQAMVRTYNDWLIEFCNVAPDRFWGLAMISLWDIEHAVIEMDRCKNAGLRGVAVWPEPPEELPFSSPHYDKFWDAAQSLQMPVNLHISGGAPNVERAVSDVKRVPDPQPAPGSDDDEPRTGDRHFNVDRLRRGMAHPARATQILTDLILARVLGRYPGLRIVIAEIGWSWMPYCAQELDYYFSAYREYTGDLGSEKLPSEQVFSQVFATFKPDPAGAHLLPKYGKKSFLWANDYPHASSTWPHDDAVIAHMLGHLSPEDRADVLCNNTARLFNEGKLPPPADPPGDVHDLDAWTATHQPVHASMPTGA